jgi:hypothetical protein
MSHIIGLISFGLVILVELNGHISLIGLGCFNGLLACAREKMWYSNNNDALQDRCFAAAILAAAATHLELGVATSANKIANALALYFCAASLYYGYWFMREGLLWHVPRLNSNPSYHGDALQ